jgi:hypothetical protein
VRADLTDSAISLSDVRLIAQNIAGLRTGNMEKRPRPQSPSSEAPRREAMPQSLPEGFAPAKAKVRKNTGSEKALERLRKDVENNPDVATMTSGEILERFRSDVQKKEAKPLP